MRPRGIASLSPRHGCSRRSSRGRVSPRCSTPDRAARLGSRVPVPEHTDQKKAHGGRAWTRSRFQSRLQSSSPTESLPRARGIIRDSMRAEPCRKAQVSNRTRELPRFQLILDWSDTRAKAANDVAEADSNAVDECSGGGPDRADGSIGFKHHAVIPKVRLMCSGRWFLTLVACILLGQRPEGSACCRLRRLSRTRLDASRAA